MGWDGYENRAPRQGRRVRHHQRHGLLNPPALIETCSCGGQIVATRNTEQDVMAAVQAHQATERHQAWRAAR